MIHNIPVDGADEAATCGIAGSAACTPSTVSTALRDAYWHASRLINMGWTIRRIGTTDQKGFFVAETPRRRVVSVVERAGGACSDQAAQFARSITTLAAAGAAEGRDHLRDLVRLLSANTPARRPAILTWRTCNIPGLPEQLQPTPKVRAAYWFAVTLTDDYGWKLFEIGRDTARGGFIADVPGEAMAVYPASISDDRTVASAFARLLARMSTNDVVIVAALVNWHNSARHHEDPKM